MVKITELQEIKVSYDHVRNTDSVTTSSKAHELCKRAYLLSDACISLREYFYVIFLNRANNIIGFYQLSSGGISGTVADLRLAFSIALKCLASGIIICHNHPSGNLKSSQEDINLTKKFCEAGKILDVHVLDHIILTDDGYTSLADEGLI